MKTVILCGGKGTRMKEETEFKPKPMVLIGGRPILWHIMKIYAHFGYNEFILTLGYKGDMIRDYFLKHRFLTNDFTLDTSNSETEFHGDNSDYFKITFAETGIDSSTADRLLLVKKYINEDDFMLTYGDGIADIDIQKLVAFHKKKNSIGTITGVQQGRSKFGITRVDSKNKRVIKFEQKPFFNDFISAGFMVFKRDFFKYLKRGEIMERGLMRVAKAQQLHLYHNRGFWKAMDTYNEMEELNEAWNNDRPWAVWERSGKY